MAYEASQPIKLDGHTANADLSAAQYKLVKIASAGKVDVCSAVTDIPIGVLQNKPVSGATAEVVVVGITKVVGSAALSAGAEIVTNGSALATAGVAGTDTTKYVVGVVLKATAGANELATVVLNCASPARLA